MGVASFPRSGSFHSHHLGIPSCNESALTPSTPPPTPPLQQGHERIQPGQAATAAGEKGVTSVSRETPVPGGAPAPASNSPNRCIREIKATFFQSLFSCRFSPSAPLWGTQAWTWSSSLHLQEGRALWGRVDQWLSQQGF